MYSIKKRPIKFGRSYRCSIVELMFQVKQTIRKLVNY